jgi:hypothetical protein
VLTDEVLGSGGIPNDGGSGFGESPGITVNHHVDVGSTSDVVFAAYTHRNLSASGTWEGAWAHSATVSGSTDTWGEGEQIPELLPEPANNEDRMSTDVTIRFDGRPRTVMFTDPSSGGDAVVTNTELIAQDPTGVGALGPLALTTNAENIIDIWVAHDTGVANSELRIVRIDP